MAYNFNFAIAISFYTDNLLSVVSNDKIVEVPADRPMGICFLANKSTMAVATNKGIDFFEKVKDPQSDNYIYRQKLTTYSGFTDGHELVNLRNAPVLANTFFNCLSVPAKDKDFQVVYQPKFVTDFVAEDRIHLNGIALENDQLHYISCFSDRYVKEKKGWAKNPDTGCVWDVLKEKAVIKDLTLPHSPRVIDGKLFVCDSGKGRVLVRDGDKIEVASSLKSFTRGLIAYKDYIIVGTSRFRESEYNKQMDVSQLTTNKCGIHLLDRKSYKLLQSYYFENRKDIFDIQIIPNNHYPVTINSEPYRFLHIL